MPVLLLHGGGARSETFAIPGPDLEDRPRCLRDWLWEKGFEPWLLDWRASVDVVDRTHEKLLLERFDLDWAAREDIPWALQQIREARKGSEGIGAVGHCLGAGALAQAIASGFLKRFLSEKEEPRLTHVVLLTLGLFYRPPWDNRLKNQDRPLERLWRSEVTRVDPRSDDNWPPLIDELYQNWFRPQRPHAEQGPSKPNELCNRVSFMFGPPYQEQELVPEIHENMWRVSFERGTSAPVPGQVLEGEQSGAKGRLHEIEVTQGTWRDRSAAGVLWLYETERRDFREYEGLRIGDTSVALCKRARHDKAQLPRQFGSIPLKMYLQAARNVARRGQAGGFDTPLDHKGLTHPQCRKPFDDLHKTLITGKKNRLWSPDSIDAMYAWLWNGTRKSGTCVRVQLPDYGHQDLLWGKSAREDVFPKIEEGLRRTTSRP